MPYADADAQHKAVNGNGRSHILTDAVYGAQYVWRSPGMPEQGQKFIAPQPHQHIILAQAARKALPQNGQHGIAHVVPMSASCVGDYNYCAKKFNM